MGASWIGTWQPTRSVKAVRSMPASMAPQQLPDPSIVTWLAGGAGRAGDELTSAATIDDPLL
jgi:hypothetical protein